MGVVGSWALEPYPWDRYAIDSVSYNHGFKQRHWDIMSEKVIRDVVRGNGWKGCREPIRKGTLHYSDQYAIDKCVV